MLYNPSSYIARFVDKNGIAAYTAEDDAVWQQLITRQQQVIQGRACKEYMDGLKLLNLPHDRIPQCHEISAVLKETTGWILEPVPALISFDHFFYLLANHRFPAATFIRNLKELAYLKEPDIFHEIVGHCPLLTNQAYADFTWTYGKLGYKASPYERIMLARLFWFTIEFGLLNTPQGLRAYGGGILSSIDETVYCLESTTPERKPFDPNTMMRTHYRIDIMQPTYFILNSFEQLYHLIELDLLALIRQAQQEKVV